MKKIINYSLSIKIIFCLVITILASIGFDYRYLIVGIFEILLVTILSNIIALKNKILGNIVGYLLFLLYFVEEAVLYTAKSYVTLTMLVNLNSIEDIFSNLVNYIPLIMIAIIVVFMPFEPINIKYNNKAMIGFSLLVALTISNTLGTQFSSYYGLKSLYNQYKQYQSLQNQISGILSSGQDLQLYKDGIDDYIAKDENLVDQPNVILIFTEGLSQEIIDSELNLMPNLKQFQNECITFDNYYNHTFATYAGIIGQLTSSFNSAERSQLPTLQSILHNQGYFTEFINTEPNNQDFTNYLTAFNFDELKTSNKLNGDQNSISDKDAYELIYDEAINLNDEGKPFLLSTYTFGTHAWLNSQYQTYGDGSSNFKNKFYNADYEFGKFLEKFKNSSLYDNTIIVFTADHATYTEEEYYGAISNSTREHSEFSEIPLCIYYKDCKAKIINVDGKTSLSLTPTILDFLDISDNNSFLGVSLFNTSSRNDYDNYFYSDGWYAYVKGNKIILPTEEETAQFDTYMATYNAWNEMNLN